MERKEIKIFWKKGIIILVIIILILAVFLEYFSANQPKPCIDESCFFDSLKDCQRVYFSKEDSKYSWLYTVREASENSCGIKVRLLKVKQANEENIRLEGKEMICVVLKGYTEYPEKDIAKCTGILKEELQDLVIQRIHDYLLVNSEEIKTNFLENPL